MLWIWILRADAPFRCDAPPEAADFAIVVFEALMIPSLANSDKTGPANGLVRFYHKACCHPPRSLTALRACVPFFPCNNLERGQLKNDRDDAGPRCSGGDDRKGIGGRDQDPRTKQDGPLRDLAVLPVQDDHLGPVTAQEYSSHRVILGS